MNKKLSSSLEDYLEAILNIMENEGKVRITDISEYLNVKKPSVHSAITKLKNLKLVEHEKYENIFLTEKGKQEAKRIKNKHDIILSFLSDFLGIQYNQAVKEACKIEHIISNDTYRRLEKFIELIDSLPSFDKTKWKSSFEKYLNDGDIADEIH